MIAKLIRVQVKPGRRSAYLAAQTIWNRETEKADGYVGRFCGLDSANADVVQVIVFWRSRRDLDRWMATEHDRIQALAGADQHIERHEVTVLDEVEPGPSAPA